MANGKIGVGATIGIVVGVTAAIGLGLYLILKPKKAIAETTPNTGGSSITSSQVAALQAQLAKMQADAIASQNNISQQQKDLNKQQLNSILFALGGKIAGAGVDKLINSFSRPNYDTSYVPYDKSGMYDVSTPTYLDPTLPAWAQDYINKG
jgi:hypothetical protein